MKENKKIEILLATMNQENDDLLDKMNVKTDIIVCNQNKEKFSMNKYIKEKYDVIWYNFIEKGVGLNRNNALLRSNAEICIIADDDITYVDNYEKIILKAFEENKNADVILFNIYSNDKNRFICKKKMNVNITNCGKFGGVRIAFRRNSVLKKTISFSNLFGGGAKYSAGEDVAFIRDCIVNGLKVISVPEYILELREERESTWFKGYNEKYFKDLGALYSKLYGKFARMFAIIQIRRKRKTRTTNIKKSDIKKYIFEGIEEYRKL